MSSVQSYPGAPGRRSALLRFTSSQSQGDEVSRGIALPAMTTTSISTRVQAPASSMDRPPCPSAASHTAALVTDGSQSPSRDGSIPMPSDKRAGQPIDMRCKVKIATWNVMSLSGTGYQVAGNILASIRAERRGCRSHWSLLPVRHHLSPTFSHLWTHSKARRGSACPQGAPQLHQPISWTSTGPSLEASSWSSTWQVDRPAPKR